MSLNGATQTKLAKAFSSLALRPRKKRVAPSCLKLSDAVPNIKFDTDNQINLIFHDNKSSAKFGSSEMGVRSAQVSRAYRASAEVPRRFSGKS